MHHVYQRNFIGSSIFPDEAFLVTYPEIPENEALKIKENEILLRLLFEDDSTAFQDNLNLFYSIRKRREKIIGAEYMEYKKETESVEGPAVYCEYRFLKAIKGTDNSSKLSTIFLYGKFLFPLTRLKFGRNNLRDRLLNTGLVQCLILSKNEPNWKKEYYESGLLLNDFFFKKLPAHEVDIPAIPSLLAYASHFVSEEKQKRQKRFNDFESQEGVHIDIIFKTFPEIKGFDPMNAEGIDSNTVIHNGMLQLGKKENFLSLDGNVCTKVKESVWMVQSLFFFIDNKHQLKVKDGYISLDIPGKRIKWTGRIVSKKEEQITIELE